MYNKKYKTNSPYNTRQEGKRAKPHYGRVYF
jgi:hypothetical protein